MRDIVVVGPMIVNHHFLFPFRRFIDFFMTTCELLSQGRRGAMAFSTRAMEQLTLVPQMMRNDVGCVGCSSCSLLLFPFPCSIPAGLFSVSIGLPSGFLWGVVFWDWIARVGRGGDGLLQWGGVAVNPRRIVHFSVSVAVPILFDDCDLGGLGGLDGGCLQGLLLMSFLISES